MTKKIRIVISIIAICLIAATAYTIHIKRTGIANNSNSKTSVQQNNLTSAPPKSLAPNFTLKDTTGKNISLSDYLGKIVVLNFWTTWCTYCTQELPSLIQLNTELAKDPSAVIIGINVQEPMDTIQKYVTANKINFTIVSDSDSSIAKSYNISGYPTTFIIGKDGAICTSIPGPTTDKTVLKIIEVIKEHETSK